MKAKILPWSYRKSASLKSQKTEFRAKISQKWGIASISFCVFFNVFAMNFCSLAMAQYEQNLTDEELITKQVNNLIAAQGSLNSFAAEGGNKNAIGRSEDPQFASGKVLKTNAKPNESSVDENAIKQLLMAEGEVTLDDYNKFWRAVPIKNLDEKKAAIQLITNDFLVFTEFNKALLDCAEIAWIQRNEVRCEKARDVTSRIIQKYSAKKDDLQSMMVVQRAQALEQDITGVIRSAASRGTSLNKNPQYKISSLEEIRKDRIVLNRVIARGRAFMKIKFEPTS